MAFLNAASMASLVADFGRLHDFLQLGGAKDKVRSVKTWLSRPENSQWLLVFDNADDLKSVPIHKYFPAVNWGHIIITSRDQAVIGSVAEEGHVLDPLTTDDATQLLLERSGIRYPSQIEKEEASKIASLLGSLPLALVQAGAFVRSRQKTLQDYRKLFMNRRNDLLRSSPLFGGTDRTIFTAWEINFKQVEQDSSDARNILLLFSFLESSCIPESVLHRGSSPQRRWGNSGEVVEIRAEDEGVDICLINVIQGDLEFDMAIEKLLSFSLISCNRESDGLRNFSIHPLVQYCVAQRLSPVEVSKWRWQALLLICHAFPRNKYIEPQYVSCLVWLIALADKICRYGEIGRLMMSQLSRVLSEYDAMCLEKGEQTSFRHELASTLLAASRFSDAPWKGEAICRTKQLLGQDNEPYMNAWLAYRESAVMRMSGMLKNSESTLHGFLHHLALPSKEDPQMTPRYNAQRGELVISFSENLVRQGRLSEAKAELIEWSPLSKDCSTLETIVLRARDIILGKVLRFQGRFSEALALLDGVVQSCHLDDFFEGTGWYRVLLSEVADLYCELDRPSDAESLLLQELTPMIERGTQDIATGRRLRMSLAETYLQRKMYAEAESLLVDLRQASLLSGAPDYTAKINIFRIWVSLARVLHGQSRWQEALSSWRQALSALDSIKLSWGLNAGLVRCSIAHALMMMGHEEDSARASQEANANMASESRVYWIPLFNSRWHDFILEKLQKD